MKLSDGQKSWLEKCARRYHAALDPATASYLAARGLDQDDVRGSLLGLVADPDPLHGDYVGRLSIPFITPTGVVGIRFRCLVDHDCHAVGCPKYLGVEGAATHIYNVQALHDADTVIGVSEGELDAVVATKVVPTVGIPGINNWKPFYYRLFEDFERVLIFGDGDKAGRSFAGKLSSSIPGGEGKVLEAGHDVTSYVLAHGLESFREFALA